MKDNKIIMALFIFVVIFSINCVFATSNDTIHKNLSSVNALSINNSTNNTSQLNTTKKVSPVHKVKTSYKKVAIILPHPDDETIGVGGLIQYLKSHG
ncbi:MAG TPA: hypothetical protein VHO92_01265, partial [Methanobacterium sp.]|nr:hypothetical protein [Methanobacterium sp.]